MGIRRWNRVYRLAIAAVSFLFISGCDNGSSPPESGDQSEILRNYLTDNDMDLPELLADWIITADSIHGNESGYHIIDIRNENSYNRGHIPFAVHSSLSDVLTEAAESEGKPIVVVCYTGQSAGYAVMALRLSGYSDAKALKFGMSSWHSDFDDWTIACSDIALGSAGWTAPPGNVSADTLRDYPIIKAGSSKGEGILAERVAAMLDGGFKGINAYTVLLLPSAYFINGCWAGDNVTAYGNIAGASNIYPVSLLNDAIAKHDPDAKIVSYCSNGHASSMVTAYLTVLGYDAVSLKFGANGMIYGNLTSDKWNGSFDFEYETESP
jgi:rhodanese-related sulfurtransferase